LLQRASREFPKEILKIIGVDLDITIAVRRIVAILVILLVASPVTAPFSTYDLASTNLLHADSHFLSSEKALQDFAVMPSPMGPAQIVEPHERFKMSAGSARTGIGSFGPLVLRL